MIRFGELTYLGVTVPVMEGASEEEIESLKRQIKQRLDAALLRALQERDEEWIKGTDQGQPPRGIANTP